MNRTTARALGSGLSVACTVALLASCGTPVGVKRMDPTTVQRSLTRSILTSDTLSTTTQNVLFEHDLVARWDEDPRGAIAALHEVVARGEARRNDVFALAELSFAHAENARDRAFYRGTVV
jgi:hypothetical protein